jgi:PAS domain S-box-containing protein
MSQPDFSKAEEQSLIKTGALDQIKDAILAVDNQDKLTYINKAAAKYYNIDREKALGSNLTKIYTQMWFSPEDEHNANISLEKEGFWQGINIQQRPDGDKAVIESAITVIKDQAGNKTGLLSILRDITGRGDVDQWLLESNQRLKHVIEAAEMMVYEIDQKTKKITVIRGIEQLLGYSTGEVPSNIDWWISQIHPDDIYIASEQFYPTRSVDKEVNKYRIHNKSGDYITVQGAAKVILDKAGNPERIIGGMQDITRYIEMQQTIEEKSRQLQDVQKMAIIGQIAGMVGHDIRNPLQSLTSDIYLIQSELDSMPESKEKECIKESLANMDRDLEYANKIIQDLQDFSKKIVPKTQETDLEILSKEVLEKIVISAKVEVSCQLEVKKIITDADLLKRILFNLINNAVQAMPNGGKLSIKSYRETGDNVITVQDTGVGISEDNKAKLFTPLFTTKSKGQGFGLVVIKRMTEALGGAVFFESEIGKGTKFIVRFPSLKKKN